MYKVLDIREYNEISDCKLIAYGNNMNGAIDLKQRRITVVICENEESKKRKRFEFYEGYEVEMFGEICYLGYSGDYDSLIVGDKFEIIETPTYKQVSII